MRLSVRRALLAALPLAPAAATAQRPAARVPAARVQAVADSLAKAALANNVAGLAIAVVRGRDTLVMKGYGLADVENEIPVTPRTVFRIGSVTKQFTSAAVMKLVEQGKVGLDDEITKYFPDFPIRGERILVRHLLNHTSGIPSYTDVGPRFGRVARLDLARDSLLAIVKNDTLMFAPGTGFYYNNTGYYMLGMLIEKVTGRPYGQHLSETQFAPLGLTGTTYCGTRPIIKRRAQGYEVASGQLVNADYLSMELPYAAGSLCSTVGDLVAWTAALHAGKVVSPASFRQMTTPVKLDNGYRMTYGYGLGVDSVSGHRVVSHGGGINGFISQLNHYPDDSLAVVVLANTAPAPSTPIADNLARAALGLPFRTPPRPPTEVAPLAAAERARYVGEYAVRWTDGTTRTARVFEEEGQLKVQLQGQPAIRLLSQGGDAFAPERPGPTIRFTVRDGRAATILFDQGARPLMGARVR
jgi:CubicO group peptidase (beta-lactamase class C family)